MNFFNRMKDSVSSVSVEMGQKLSSTTDTLKLNNQIRNNNKELEKLTLEVGKKCIELHLLDTDSEYEDLFSQIRHYYEENDKLQTEIQRLTEESKEKTRLYQLEIQKKQAQRELERKEREKLKQQQIAEQNSSVCTLSCPNCGKENAQDAKFCVFCGSPLPQKKEPPAFVLCPSCSKENSEDAKFCVFCGTPLSSQPSVDSPSNSLPDLSDETTDHKENND